MNFIPTELFAVVAGLTGASSVSAQPLPIRDTQEILQEATKYTVRIRARSATRSTANPPAPAAAPAFWSTASAAGS